MSIIDTASVAGFDYVNQYQGGANWPVDEEDENTLRSDPGRSASWPADRREITIHLTGVSATASWFQKTFARLVELLNLGPNWNGYGERPVHASSVKRLIRILDAVRYSGSPVTVVPLAGGGLQMEWHSPSASLEVEVPPVGDAVGWYCRHDLDVDDEWVVTARQGLALLAERLREFP